MVKVKLLLFKNTINYNEILVYNKNVWNLYKIQIMLDNNNNNSRVYILIAKDIF